APPPPRRRLGLIFGTLVFVVALVAGTGIWTATHRPRVSRPDILVPNTTAAPRQRTSRPPAAPRQ
ncbi:hypothetical protein, partial [Mycobacterium tilburgii]|uniref:hypothetical protein n=1 Tax=Mycobacterium tilburgii TaxID=44467 RepID=UPI0021B1C05C